MNWADEYKLKIDEQLAHAGNHVIVVPAQDADAPIDTVDVFDGAAHAYIATRVPEKQASNFAAIWNAMIDNGDTTALRKIDLAWFSGIVERQVYGE